MSTLPPHVRAEVRRILDGAARRILEETNNNPGRSLPRTYRDRLNDGFDNPAFLGEGEEIPVHAGKSKARFKVGV